MLFESFTITISYRDLACEFDISERYGFECARCFEITQGGICILILIFENNVWRKLIPDGLHPVVKQDTETFVSQELVNLLITAIKNHYDCFTERKILNSFNKN